MKKKLGRPKMSDDEKRVILSVSLDPKIVSSLRSATALGGLSMLVETILRKALKHGWLKRFGE